MRRTDLESPPPLSLAAPTGAVELVNGAQHFTRVVRDGILKAKVSIDIATADFKAMLVPGASGMNGIHGVGECRRSAGRRRASGTGDAVSIVEVFRCLASRGVEVRVLHAGVPSSPALRELRSALPSGLTIRRCPRIHMKAIIIDCASMYLGSANLTGAGLGAKGQNKRNFELGVWTTATPLIDSVLGEFNALWEGQRCKACQRKDVCPVPLEEPKLS
jgi:phosphatidylserine/phosphatidylglycerophosphate/cardiolipin synthase-like enzyme